MGLGGEFGDPDEEALFDPLQDEPVGREQPVAVGRRLERRGQDPRVELLGRQFLAERVEAALPESGNQRHAGVNSRRHFRPADNLSRSCGAGVRRAAIDAPAEQRPPVGLGATNRATASAIAASNLRTSPL